MSAAFNPNPPKTERNEALVKDYLGGDPVKTLSDRYGIGPGTIAAILDRVGVDRRKGPTAHERVRRLFLDEGLSINAIAARVGSDPRTISRWLTLLGLYDGRENRSKHDHTNHWLAPTKTEAAMLAQIQRDGGFPIAREAETTSGKFGVYIPETKTVVVCRAVTIRWAA